MQLVTVGICLVNGAVVPEKVPIVINIRAKLITGEGLQIIIQPAASLVVVNTIRSWTHGGDDMMILGVGF